MNVLIAQIIALLAILSLGYVVFRYFPIKIRITDITITSFLIMLSIVLSAFSMQIPLFGVMSLKIGFSQMPLMLMGVIMGPTWAFIGGLVQDILDVLINPSGFPFLGFTLNKVLIATIPALWFCKWNKLDQKKVFNLVWILLIAIFSLTLIGIYSTETITVNQTMIIITSQVKLLLTIACMVVMTLLIIIMLYFQRKYPFSESRYHIANWIICVLLIEIMIQLILTPIWLDVMYGIPYIMNVLVRMIKASFMIFLNIMIGYYLLRLLNRIRKVKDVQD
ncbi:MAG: folate family ECF transporter S component [Erysipelotrichaceae bacterium]|nr:folate family ECF transporter S component [Erysipelotrichaceae bacterium]